MQFSIGSSFIIVPAIVAWIGITAFVQLRRGYRPSLERYVVLTGCVVYVLALLHLTAFPIDVHTGEAKSAALRYSEARNLVPFAGLRPLDFVLNLVMTVPFGILVPVVFRRMFPFPVMLAIAVCVGAFFEMNQLLLRWTVGNDRYVDINDVIANTGGVLLGFGLARWAMQDRRVRRWATATILR